MANLTNNPAMTNKAKKTALRKEPALKQIYGKPEKRNVMPLILGWGFILIAAAVITWMIAVNPPQKHLSCSRPGGHSASLIEFGTCTEN